jgi:hypothetical protein
MGNHMDVHTVLGAGFRQGIPYQRSNASGRCGKGNMDERHVGPTSPDERHEAGGCSGPVSAACAVHEQHHWAPCSALRVQELFQAFFYQFVWDELFQRIRSQKPAAQPL